MKYTYFKVRTTCPKKGDKNYTKASKGGKIEKQALGKPSAWDGSVLSNCIGYCHGRWLEVHEEITGKKDDPFPYFNCDGENAITWAKKYGLETGDIPRPMAMLCFAKGKPGVHDDGAGHVQCVEKVNEDGSLLVSESIYGGTAFRTKTITNKNGRWGQDSKHTFRGFIYHPDIKEVVEPLKLKVGDAVYITKKGNANSFGTGKAAASGGKVKFVILKIYEDRPFPYQVGLVKKNGKQTRGFYKETALKLV